MWGLFDVGPTVKSSGAYIKWWSRYSTKQGCGCGSPSAPEYLGVGSTGLSLLTSNFSLPISLQLFHHLLFMVNCKN